jgi:RNA polymerase sigma factor (sigma-70 family)
VPLRGYAVPTITGEIRRYRRDHCWAVRPPRTLQELILKVTRCVDRLTTQTGRSPAPADVAEALGETEEAVVEALVAGRAYLADSLDAPAFRRDEDAPPRWASPWARRRRATSARSTPSSWPASATSSSEDEWRLLHLRFVADWTQEQIGKSLGVSQMTVSRRQRAALQRLHERLARDTALLAELGLDGRPRSPPPRSPRRRRRRRGGAQSSSLRACSSPSSSEALWISSASPSSAVPGSSGRPRGSTARSRSARRRARRARRDRPRRSRSLLLAAAGLAHRPLGRVEVVLVAGHAADRGGLRGGQLGLLGGKGVVVLLPGIALHAGPLPAGAAGASRAAGRAGRRSLTGRPARVSPPALTARRRPCRPHPRWGPASNWTRRARARRPARRPRLPGCPAPASGGLRWSRAPDAPRRGLRGRLSAAPSRAAAAPATGRPCGATRCPPAAAAPGAAPVVDRPAAESARRAAPGVQAQDAARAARAVDPNGSHPAHPSRRRCGL